MKVRRLRSFWSLSPTAAARSLERACWLAAALLVLALALATGPAATASARVPTAVAPEKASILILQRRCIDRILGQALGKSEEAVVEQMYQQCMAPRPARSSSTGGIVLLSCERPATVRVSPATKRVAGCLGG
jgi:hypothetical protein